MKLVWVDVETTGLRPTDAMLSLGIRITGSDLKTIAEKEWDIHYETLGEEKFEDPKVYQMHKELIARCLRAPFNRREVYTLARGFLADQLYGEQGILAGSSVHFDKAVLGRQMPRVLDFVGYRLLDVSVFKVIAEVWRPDLKDKKTPVAHTPLADLDGTIRILKHYAKAMLKEGVLP
jgi:oligoribonuclease